MPVVHQDPRYNVPNIKLPSGEYVCIVSEDLRGRIQDLPPALQRKAVRMLEEYRQEVYAIPKGTTEEERMSRLNYIDGVSWQLAQVLRYSTPTRINEALAPLTFLADSRKQVHGPGAVDVVPTLYLGVALSRIEGEEERSIRAFKEAFSSLHTVNPAPALNLIWARANLARLFRRMNRLSEAEEQEALARQWILRNPYTFRPSKITAAIADDMGTGSNILDHPDIIDLYSDAEELGPKTTRFGTVIITHGN